MNRAVGKRWMYGRRGHALIHSWRQIVARPVATALTLLVLGITLALPLLLVFSAQAVGELGSQALEGESLTLYLSSETDDLPASALADEIATRPNVRETRFVSAAEALESLRRNTDLGDAVDALGSNPLPGAIIVYPSADALDSASIDALAGILGRIDGVERVQFDLRWVKRLQAVVALLRVVAGVLGAFLVLTALLVIANTIRLELLRRQAESEVAHLLGASTVFRHRPFVYTGALYGLLGGLIGCTLALGMLLWIRAPADELARLYSSAFRLTLPGPVDVLWVLLACTMLGLLGSALTLARSSSELFPSGPAR